MTIICETFFNFRSAVNNGAMVAANNAIMKVNNLDQLSYDSTNIKRVRLNNKTCYKQISRLAQLDFSIRWKI